MDIDNLTSQTTATNKAWERFKYNRDKKWGLAGLDTGIHDLNLAIGGLIPTKVTTIAGRSGMGKSSIVTPLFNAGTRIQDDRRAEFLFFSWEMDASIITDRHVSFKTMLSMGLLTQGAKLLDANTIQRVKDAYAHSRSLPVTYQQSSTDIRAVTALSEKFVEKCKEKSKIEGIYVHPVIVIDYIGMAKFEGSGLRTYGIGDFMNGLKQFANKSGASVVVLAQINRASDDKAAPDKSDLSDSQSIENASDNLILIHRPEYNRVPQVKDPETGIYIDSGGKMILRAWKSRDHGISDALIDCKISVNRFKNRHHNYDTEYWKLYEDENFWKKHYKLDRVKTNG